MIPEILETRIPGFFILHLPDPKFALSAYEHMLIVNARKEFLPPETALFQSLDGVFVALFVPKRVFAVLLRRSERRVRREAAGGTAGELALRGPAVERRSVRPLRPRFLRKE